MTERYCKCGRMLTTEIAEMCSLCAWECYFRAKGFSGTATEPGHEVQTGTVDRLATLTIHPPHKEEQP